MGAPTPRLDATKMGTSTNAAPTTPKVAGVAAASAAPRHKTLDSPQRCKTIGHLLTAKSKYEYWVKPMLLRAPKFHKGDQIARLTSPYIHISLVNELGLELK